MLPGDSLYDTVRVAVNSRMVWQGKGLSCYSFIAVLGCMYNVGATTGGRPYIYVETAIGQLDVGLLIEGQELQPLTFIFL